MRDIFSKLIDHPIMLFLSKMVDLFFLNLLFLITCIPVFTIGAALTSLYYICVSEWDTQNVHLISKYFKSFKSNFGQAFILWCIMLSTGSILGGITLMVFMQWKSTSSTAMTVALVVCALFVFVYALIFAYVWPLQAKFANTVPNTIKNAFLMSVSNLPGTVVSILLVGVVGFFVYQLPVVRVLMILFGFSFIAYMQSKIYRIVFEPYFIEAEQEESNQLQEELAKEMEEKEKTRLQKQAEMFAKLDALKEAQKELEESKEQSEDGKEE